MHLSEYINTDKALAIISAIFVSIIIAFAVGSIIMFLTRILFTFFYEKKSLFWGSIYSGISIAIISYFIFIKGLHDVSFVSKNNIEWINNNLILILSSLSIILSLFFILIQFFIKINIFKIVVLFGTFALAMAFAGNDLVNFIGVPVAGFEAFQDYSINGNGNPHTFSMESLANPIKTDMTFLLIAGIIMIFTIWFSKKAKSVIDTSVNLSRQKDGDEKFDSNQLSRAIVRFFYNLNGLFNTKYSRVISVYINKRFRPQPFNKKENDPPAFDMLRASVNLIVASTLIAFATSMKLPLSTTYVAFMVAMGTSFSDKAWGRESAVYRVSGVFAVIGGWFLTAFIAFFLSALIALLLWWGDLIAICIIIPIVFFVLYRTHILHKKTQAEKKIKSSISEKIKSGKIDLEEITYDAVNEVMTFLLNTLSNVYSGLKNEDIKLLKKNMKKVKSINKKVVGYKNIINEAIANSSNIKVEMSEYFIKTNESLNSIITSLTFITRPAYLHISNIHKSLSKNQLKDFKILLNEMSDFINFITEYLKNHENINEDIITNEHINILNKIDTYRVNQIERIRRKETPSRSNLLFLNIVSEFKILSNLVLEIYLLEKTKQK